MHVQLHDKPRKSCIRSIDVYAGSLPEVHSKALPLLNNLELILLPNALLSGTQAHHDFIQPVAFLWNKRLAARAVVEQ